MDETCTAGLPAPIDYVEQQRQHIRMECLRLATTPGGNNAEVLHRAAAYAGFVLHGEPSGPFTHTASGVPLNVAL